MTRFFYPSSRAHHAYSMAIDFGMRFKKRNGLWEPEGLIHLAGLNCQIEIAEESLPLLEPQRGDIIFFDNGHGSEAWDEFRLLVTPDSDLYPYTGSGEPLMLTDGGDYPARSRLRRIIQRNGIPFHWPESEAI